MKLILTGGHLTPALAMIDFLQSNHPEVSLSFIGRTHSRTDQPAVELIEVSQRGIRFHSLAAPKFAMVPVWTWLAKFGQLLASCFQAIKILKSEKPDCIVSFGGYLAVPVVLAAWKLKIPVVTHEQTRVAGLANRLIGKFAKYVGRAFSESQSFFDPAKTKLGGNLMSASIVAKTLPQPNWVKNPKNLAVLIITGGSQGSQKINQVIDEMIPSLINDWCVIHQRGPQTKTANQAPILAGYFSFDWLSAAELFWLWRQDRAVSLSRAGANTVSELAVAKIPAILIPLPNTYRNEQQLNAMWLAEQGGAYILAQKDLTAEVLSQLLKKVLAELDQIHLKLKLRPDQPVKAADQIWQLINLAVTH